MKGQARVTLAEIEVFLALAENLLFTRVAERLCLSPSRVSRLVASLEGQVGGRLFQRTTRQVTLTPLGVELRDRLQPAHAQLRDALDQTRASALAAGGVLRIGMPVSISSLMLNRLIDAFQAEQPQRSVEVQEVDLWDLYGPLRRRQIDVLVHWAVLDEPDLTAGPVIERRSRALAVGVSHRLARREWVSVEDLADEQIDTGFHPPALLDAFAPAITPSGRPIPRGEPARSIQATIYNTALGRVVHPTMTGVPTLTRPDIVLVPIRDLPPMPLGLIWCSGREDARIDAFAEMARSLTEALHRPGASQVDAVGFSRHRPYVAPSAQGGTRAALPAVGGLRAAKAGGARSGDFRSKPQ
ncbi:MAG: LysR family transcriptional regulator [Acidimicrobiales bacterium]